MYFYLIEVDFALIDLRWWRWRRVVDGLIIFVGLHGAGDCTSLAGARCRGRHVEASVMVGRVCVVGWGVPSAGCRHWLLLLGGMFRVVFGLGTRWMPNVGINKPRAT
jgi:hypothetical protein